MNSYCSLIMVSLIITGETGENPYYWAVCPSFRKTTAKWKKNTDQKCIIWRWCFDIASYNLIPFESLDLDYDKTIIRREILTS
jgi:hypothetical protein